MLKQMKIITGCRVQNLKLHSFLSLALPSELILQQTQISVILQTLVTNCLPSPDPPPPAHL